MGSRYRDVVLPPPSDIGPGLRTEWDFNPPDTPAARHTLCPLLTSAPRSRALRRAQSGFRTRRGSPEVSSTAFPAHPPDLPPRPLMTADFAVIRPLVRPGRPCMGRLMSSGFGRHGFGPDQGCTGGGMVAPLLARADRPGDLRTSWSGRKPRSIDERRGSLPSGADHRATTLYSVGPQGPDHDAVMRIGGEAPGRRAHSRKRY